MNKSLFLYIHGKGGTAEEAEHYKPLFPHCDVVGLDYKAETPFTLAGAKELLRLGIITICAPLCTMILAQIISSIVAELIGCGEAFKLAGSDSVALGVMFIVISCCAVAERSLWKRKIMTKENRLKINK